MDAAEHPGQLHAPRPASGPTRPGEFPEHPDGQRRDDHHAPGQLLHRPLLLVSEPRRVGQRGRQADAPRPCRHQETFRRALHAHVQGREFDRQPPAHRGEGRRVRAQPTLQADMVQPLVCDRPHVQLPGRQGIPAAEHRGRSRRGQGPHGGRQRQGGKRKRATLPEQVSGSVAHSTEAVNGGGGYAAAAAGAARPASNAAGADAPANGPDGLPESECEATCRQ